MTVEPVVVVVSPCRVTPCVSDNESLRRTLQAVYLLWLFLRITTMCNLCIIGLVLQRFPELVAHAQTVDTRPLFPPPTWPGYEARQAHVTRLFDIYAHEGGEMQGGGWREGGGSVRGIDWGRKDM